jgi:hypothetical protein
LERRIRTIPGILIVCLHRNNENMDCAKDFLGRYGTISPGENETDPWRGWLTVVSKHKMVRESGISEELECI